MFVELFISQFNMSFGFFVAFLSFFSLMTFVIALSLHIHYKEQKNTNASTLKALRWTVIVSGITFAVLGVFGGFAQLIMSGSSKKLSAPSRKRY